MQIHPSLKPSAAWATDLIDKYRFNPFYKTATNVVFLQVLLACISIVLFLVGIKYVQETTLESITFQIQSALINGATTTDAALPQAIDDVRDQTFLYAFIGILLMHAFFGFLIARFALWPTRNSLQFQKRFIGNVAHEIRTPLAIIKTNTEVALFDPNLPKATRETFEQIIVELDRISETINNLLSFDTLTRPRRMLRAPVDIAQIAEIVADRHRALAGSRGITLSVISGEVRHAHGNAVALDQVITNLVKNAVNYTPENKDGSVTVHIEPENGNRIVIRVLDTGVGINQKDLVHIFEPFYRGDLSRARGIGTGTSGLGLAIVNEIVRLHRGAISIRSTPGVGTEIRVILPAAGKQYIPDPLEDGGAKTNEVSVDFS